MILNFITTKLFTLYYFFKGLLPDKHAKIFFFKIFPFGIKHIDKIIVSLQTNIA